MLRRGPTLAAFVDEWWALYAEPNLEQATLRMYRWSGSGTRSRASAPCGSWT
jgi:hypothetical protein